MRIVCCVLLALAACATPAPESADAGSRETCDGGVGPLGTCIPARRACDSCVFDTDCPEGKTCEVIDGCRMCGVDRGGGDVCSASGCLTGNECCGGLTCILPGQPVCGGACRGDECEDDSSCEPPLKCLPSGAPCGCGGHPVRQCITPCPDAPCGVGEVCANHICLPGTCPDVPCDADQVCSNGNGGDVRGCIPKPCTVDGDCPTGASCILGGCHLSLGSCIPPAP